jgi:hypothetical protein
MKRPLHPDPTFDPTSSIEIARSKSGDDFLVGKRLLVAVETSLTYGPKLKVTTARSTPPETPL